MYLVYLKCNAIHMFTLIVYACNIYTHMHLCMTITESRKKVKLQYAL